MQYRSLCKAQKQIWLQEAINYLSFRSMIKLFKLINNLNIYERTKGDLILFTYKTVITKECKD